MSIIRLLDELTANQIAAGEVIERPASVVKELVENSLDARAQKISVEICKGGLELIKVTDDGCGMSPEDVSLAVKCHATSKLKEINDLNELQSLGFRGEALPSITSIARVKILTRTADSQYGTKLTIAGNKDLTVEPAGTPIGTSIVVADLFFNTPARKKFLRSEGYESGLIHELLLNFSLSHPQVSFRMIREGKEILNTAGIHSHPDLLALYYGKEVKNALVQVSGQVPGGSVTGFVSLPTYHRSNRKAINFFINHRRIFSGELMNALAEAYQNTLPKGKFPLCVLDLHLDPATVDVNVHPSKLEVRLRNPVLAGEMCFLIVQALIKQKKVPVYSLAPEQQTAAKTAAKTAGNESREEGNISRENYATAQPYSTEESATEEVLTEDCLTEESAPENSSAENSSTEDCSIEGATTDKSSIANCLTEKSSKNNSPKNDSAPEDCSVTAPIATVTATSEPAKTSTGLQTQFVQESFPNFSMPPSALENGTLTDIKRPLGQAGLDTVLPANNQDHQDYQEHQDHQDHQVSQDYPPALKIIGQLAQTFILAEGEEGLYIIDQHVAHERVIYEKLLAKASAGSLESQVLLHPVSLNLSLLEEELVIKHILPLTDMGLLLENFGSRSYLLRAVPVGISEEPQDYFYSLLQYLENQQRKTGIPEIKKNFLVHTSCKMAVKAKKKLALPEMEQLLIDLRQTKNYMTCPHGRPIIYKITNQELLKAFHRI